MTGNEVWVVSSNTGEDDFAAALRTLGLRVRMLKPGEAMKAGQSGPPPLFVLSAGLSPELSSTLPARGIAYVAVLLDQWYHSIHRGPVTPMAQGPRYLFTCAPEHLDLFQRLGWAHVELMPWGVDTDSLRPLSLSDKDRQRYGAPVSFVGTPLVDNPIDGVAKVRSLFEQLRPPGGVVAEPVERMMRLFDELVRIQSADLFRWRLPELIPELEAKYGVPFLMPGMTPEKETWMIQLGVHFSMLQRREVVRALQPLGLAVFGSADWRHAGVRGLDYRGFADRRTELAKVVNASPINVNVTKIMFGRELTPRAFEVLACGGFFLSNRTPGISSVLDEGIDYVAYESLEDLVAKARYYLEHPEERRRIAESGCRKVRERHSMVHRVSRILEVLRKDGVVADPMPLARASSTETRAS